MRGFSGGMTLVELMLAVVIIAILAGVALPTLARNPGRVEVSTAARTTQALVRYTRNISVTRGKKHRLRYDGEIGRFEIEAEADPLKSPGEFEKHRLPKNIERTYDPEKIHFRFLSLAGNGAPAEPEILFHPDGICEDFWIQIESADGRRAFTVRVFGAAGIATLDEGLLGPLETSLEGGSHDEGADSEE